MESNQQKRAWLKELHKHPAARHHQDACIFTKIVGFGLARQAECKTHERLCRIPVEGPQIVHCGFSCKSLSASNANKSQFTSCLQNATGSTGSTFHGLLNYTSFAEPPVLIMENVVDISNEKSNNNEVPVSSFEAWVRGQAGPASMKSMRSLRCQSIMERLVAGSFLACSQSCVRNGQPRSKPVDQPAPWPGTARC